MGETTAKLNWGQTCSSERRGGRRAGPGVARQVEARPGPARTRRGRGQGGRSSGKGWPGRPAPPPRGRLAARGAPLLRGLRFPGWHRASRATCWGAETPILGPVRASGAGAGAGAAGRAAAGAAASSPGARLLFSGEEVGWGRRRGRAEAEGGRDRVQCAQVPAGGRGGGHTWGDKAIRGGGPGCGRGRGGGAIQFPPPPPPRPELLWGAFRTAPGVHSGSGTKRP